MLVGGWSIYDVLGKRDFSKGLDCFLYKNKIKKFYLNGQAINVNLKELDKRCNLLINAPFKIEWMVLATPW